VIVATAWACGSLVIGFVAGCLLKAAMRGRRGVWMLSNGPRAHRCRKPVLMYAPWRSVGKRWRCMDCEQVWVVAWSIDCADREWEKVEASSAMCKTLGRSWW
jgi:hypothetical protein